MGSIISHCGVFRVGLLYAFIRNVIFVSNLYFIWQPVVSKMTGGILFGFPFLYIVLDVLICFTCVVGLILDVIFAYNLFSRCLLLPVGVTLQSLLSAWALLGV